MIYFKLFIDIHLKYVIILIYDKDNIKTLHTESKG